MLLSMPIGKGLPRLYPTLAHGSKKQAALHAVDVL